MKRTLIIGNSHVGALRLAWTKDWDISNDFSTQFWTLPARLLSKAALWSENRFGLGHNGGVSEDDINLCERLNGQIDLDLDDYDLIVDVGLPLPLRSLLSLVSNWSIEGISEIKAADILSEELFREVCRTLATDTVQSSILPKLSSKEIISIMRPLPSEKILEIDNANQLVISIRSYLADGNSLRDTLKVFFEEASLAHQRMGRELLIPAASMFSDEGLTKQKFSIGSSGVHSNRRHDDNDVSHMNTEYGRIILESISAMSSK